MSTRKGTARSRKPVGIRQIAKAAQVSIATVSRVVHGMPSVDEKLRARVADTIARLGYTPNLVARNLRTRRTSTLGVLVPTIGNAHFSDAVRAMQDSASAVGYTLLLMNSDGDAEREEAALRTLFERQVEGLVLVSTAPSPSATLRMIVERDIPVLVMDRAIRGMSMDHVLVNTRAGTRDAVLHLAGLGRRRIAFIAGPAMMWTASEKLRGYREGIEAAGMPWDPALVLQGDYTQASGGQQAFELMAQRPRPDAVIVGNNLMTLGAMRVLLRHKISIPDDLALVGYDDAAWTDVVRPALTVISQPTYELGRRSIELLLSRLADPGIKRERVVLDTTLVMRESTLGLNQAS